MMYWDGSVYDLRITIVFAKDYQILREIFDDSRGRTTFLSMLEMPVLLILAWLQRMLESLYFGANANLEADIDWEESEQRYRQRVIEALNDRLGIDDFEDHIVVEKSLPLRIGQLISMSQRATFNLAHSLDQMAYFRPRNKFEEFGNCYLVGGAPPGSGLPTIFESVGSAQISCAMNMVLNIRNPVNIMKK